MSFSCKTDVVMQQRRAFNLSPLPRNLRIERTQQGGRMARMVDNRRIERVGLLCERARACSGQPPRPINKTRTLRQGIWPTSQGSNDPRKFGSA